MGEHDLALANPMSLPPPKALTTLVYGEQDTIVEIEQGENYLSHVPHAKLVRIEASGHFDLVHPHSEAFQMLLAEFQPLRLEDISPKTEKQLKRKK